MNINAIYAGRTSPSWVIRRKADGAVLCETYSANVVARLNTERYVAVPILEYLQSLNEKVDADILDPRD